MPDFSRGIETLWPDQFAGCERISRACQQGITYTDSEAGAGNINPGQALRQYRSEFVGDARAIVLGMTSNGFTLADPNDRSMLDVVGFDTSTPAVIADFVREKRTVQGRQEAKTPAERKVSASAFRPSAILKWVLRSLGFRASA
ncbi:MAG: hypothetical protein HY735_29140 [Verrucomicrobia bacterium]|nr:hypothetical protein [Verrucomicrobiota bacterium]